MLEFWMLASLWACALLGIAAVISVWRLAREHWKRRFAYRAAVNRLMFIFFAACLIMVIEVINIGLEGAADFLFFLSEFFKSVTIFIYTDFLVKSIGFENVLSPEFSTSKFESILIRLNSFKGPFCVTHLKNHDDVFWLMLRCKISITQYCIVSFGAFIVSLFLKYSSGDNLQFGVLDINYGFLWLMLFKFLSAIVEVYHFSMIYYCFSSLENSQKFYTVSQLKFVYSGLIVTEFQWILISILTNFTELFEDGIHNISDQTVFLVSLIYSIELITFCVCSYGIFSFDYSLNVKEKSEVCNTKSDLSTTR